MKSLRSPCPAVNNSAPPPYLPRKQGRSEFEIPLRLFSASRRGTNCRSPASQN